MKTIMLFLAALVVAQLPLLSQPIITQAPTNQAVPIDGTVTLAAAAVGDTPLAYRWLKDGRMLEATNGTLTIPNAGVTNSGTYYGVVTNASGMIISLPALVTVGSPLLLTWGNNQDGQLGNGAVNGNFFIPMAVCRAPVMARFCASCRPANTL
jgi:Immunoglobulin domain/Regulator of chromosome condensation (RCC1) repeat